jgi:hypothetical protein
MLFSKYHLNSIEDIKTEEYRTKLYRLLGPQRVAGIKGNTGAQGTALLFLKYKSRHFKQRFLDSRAYFISTYLKQQFLELLLPQCLL